MTHDKIFDVAIVGGGIAGSVTAWALRDCGLSVAIIDDHATGKPIFKAERISQQTAITLKQLGLFDRLEGIALPLRSTATIKAGKIESISENVDYSTPLWKLVAKLRCGMEESGIHVIHDRVETAKTSPDGQTVFLRSQGQVACKLLVVATGNAPSLLRSLKIEREVISKNHSSTFGFDVEPGANFHLPAASASVRIYKDGADYLNLFPTPEGGYRANLFTYWPAGGQQVRNFAKGDVNDQLDSLAPQMKSLTGNWRAVGKIGCGSMSVVKSTGYEQDGFVLIGDAYGRICPCLGNGIQKALSDVLSLRKRVPNWLAAETPLTWRTVSEYYDDPERREFEDHLFKYSLFIRNRLVNKQVSWQLRRWYYDRLPLAARNLVRRVKESVKGNPGQVETFGHSSLTHA